MSTGYLFTGSDDFMDLAVVEIERLPVDDPSRKSIMIRKRLLDYGRLCTSTIIIAAASDCKSLSDDCESDFHASDLMDPDFPDTLDDDASEKQHVGDYLSDMAQCRVEEVVDTIGSMQRSWSKRKTDMSLNQYRIAKKLWELGSSFGEFRLEQNHGSIMSEEFRSIGDSLFS